MMSVHAMPITDTKELYAEWQLNIHHGHVLVSLGLLPIGACLGLHCIGDPGLFLEWLQLGSLAADLQRSRMRAQGIFCIIDEVLPMVSGFSAESSSVLKQLTAQGYFFLTGVVSLGSSMCAVGRACMTGSLGERGGRWEGVFSRLAFRLLDWMVISAWEGSYSAGRDCDCIFRGRSRPPWIAHARPSSATRIGRRPSSLPSSHYQNITFTNLQPPTQIPIKPMSIIYPYCLFALVIDCSYILMQGSEQQFDADGDRILDRRQLSVLQLEQRQQAKQSQRQNAIRVQRGFKGERAFIAKPAEIAFRDFVVGKPHFLVITLTNVSNAFNSFNVLPLPEKIRNYFQVEYVPKGKIAPGITCDIRFKFLPQLNEDITSEFTIQAETGSISYPIICTSRKTIVRCEDPTVDFARIIFGESKKVRLLIRNEGSLPSHFSFLNPNGSEIGTGNPAEEMKVIENLTLDRRGEIGGNCQKFISFQYRPSEIGPFWIDLLLAVKNVLHSPPLPIRLEGECVEVPVRVERQAYDMQICLLGHIYREKLRFYNKSEGPMSFKMTQPPETKKYFEFNPVVGYIQKQSALDVWVKFTADKDIVIYLSKFMHDKNQYAIPFQMTVKEQLLPVEFTLNFRVTSDRLTIRPPELNFGRVFEGLSSKIEVEVENQSELPQEVMLSLKKNVSIQHDQPLLKLLPLQTLRTYIYFNSSRLPDGKNYREEDRIACKVITGEIATSQLDLHYTVEVTRPDLTLAHNKIDLPALQVGEVVQAATTIRNNSNKDLVFQIFLPDFKACGLKLTPVVRHLPAKQEVQVNVEYHSFFKTLSPALMRAIAEGNKPKPPPVVQDKKEQAAPQKGKKEAKKETKLTKQQQQALEQEQKRLEEEQRLRKEKEEQEKLQQQRNFDAVGQLTKMGGRLFTFGETQHYQWLLPVYFKQKDYSDVSAQVNFLQVTTTSIAQVLSIDCREVDFGEIAVGSRAVREAVVTNKGEAAQLYKKNMPIFSSFNVLNSLKEVPQGGRFKAVLQFQPIEEQRFQQRLEFFTDRYSVSCQLKGKGVRPQVAIQPDSGLVAMGGVLLDEYAERVVKIRNVCNFQIHFTLVKVATGVNNTNSSSAFSYVPSTGAIPAHGVTEVRVRFKPDRISEKYYQKICVHVQQQKEAKHFYLTGSAYPRQAYVTSYRPIAMPKDDQLRRKPEYAFDALRLKDQTQIFGPTNKTIILEYARSDEKTTQKKLVFGSCKLLDNKMEKPTNFQIILPKDDRFTCDTPKGVAAAGAETIVTFTYKQDEADPLLTSIPALAGMGQWRQLKGQIKLSGGFVKAGAADAISLDLILRFYVSQL